MKCIKCGAKLKSNAVYCHKCGMRVDKNQNNNNDTDTQTGGSKAVIVLLVVLILLVLLGLAALGAYLFVGNQSSVIRDELSAPTPTEQPPVVATIVPKEDTEDDTKNSIKTSEKPKEKPTLSSDDENTHISDPEYKTYTDSEFKFSCSYPSHFEKYTDNTSTARYNLKTNDGEVTMRICAEKNTAGLTIQQSLSVFKSKHGGIVEYTASGESYYAIRINADGVCYYKYLRLKNNTFYWFEFTYPKEEKNIYEEYIQHIYESFTVK